MASIEISSKDYVKAAVVGLLGSLIMIIIMMLLIKTGRAPFNIPPSGAFLVTLGIPAIPWAMIVHFLYGACWSVVFVAIFKESTSMGKGFIFSIFLWLILMVVYGPMIGWGFFGTADTSELAKELQLGATGKYIIATLILHLIYGFIIGFINPRWLNLKLDTAQS